VTIDDPSPFTYNIINISFNPADSVDGLHILTSTIALRTLDPATTLTVNAMNPAGDEETSVMKEWLCGEDQSLYHLFGIAPIAAVTHFSTTGDLQNYPYSYHPRSASYPSNSPGPVTVTLPPQCP
jgi:hypothetical protein